MTSTNLLLLADGRLPAGGHAHSGGVETAVAEGRVHDLASLNAFLRGRLATAGLAAAALSAAACTRLHPWDVLDAEADARTPSPALRTVARRQGRQLLRAALILWPSPILEELRSASPATGPHHPVALGAAAAAAGLEPQDASLACVFNAVSGPAGAALRLLGFDPLQVHRILAGLGPQMDEIARLAASNPGLPPADLPSPSSPLLDLYAQKHTLAEVKLFAS